ncbi:hypothetical protein HYW82_03265 [Candidatus Peregrinibacteria bacterium]|nr:hypothetical protein [Candidatus Peregrinibacteria bacterium]
MSLFFTKKLPCWMLVFALVFQIFGANAAYGASLAETAEGENDPRILYDLVAIVVDSQLDADNNSYPGLEIDRDRKIGERVLRYAEDIRKNNDLTDVKILLFDRENDTVPELASSLENLYRNGDGTRENRLAGVVLVGDIPLPVVNKNGNRFISLFPYTDFSNKSYIFNGETETFDFNAAVAFPKPEIWHGVIRPLTNDDAGRQKLAEYFDKNHLYYEKDPDFAEFEKKLFFADLTHEEEQIFEDVYLHYEEYVESMEDLAYMRYNKFWAKDVMDDVIQDIPINEENEYNRETPDGAPGFGEQLRNTDLLDGLQDVRSKNIIDQFLIPYYRVLNRYISKVNDWAAYSGRWSNGGVSSVPALINIKDEFTKFYLRSVNDALEKKMNEVIAEIEEPLPVIDYSTISGKVGDDPFMVSLDNDGDTDMLEAAENLVFGEDFTDQFYYRYHYFNEPDNKMYVNGIEADVLDSAKQCSVYLGSTKPDYYNGELKFDPKNVNGEYSILTRSMRSDSLLSAAPMRTAGVNTRLLPPQELAEITDGNYEGGFNTDGVYETGAVIEDVPEYGVAAFLDNTLHTAAEKYEGPFEKKLRKGDVIVSVNGKKLSYAHTFDDAIKEAFDETGRFIDAMNDREPQQLADFTYDIAIKNETNILENTVDSVTDVFEPDAEYEILDTPEEIINSGRFMEIFAELDGAEKMFNEGDTVVGLMSVDFYRDGDRHTETFTFSVTIMEGGMGKITTRDEADGSELDIAVVFSDQGIPENFDPYAETEGAIFTLYDNNTLGYGYDEYDEIDNDDGGAYDASAGCNYQSTSKNSDRCIPMLATMPVLDPAGSQMPVKTEVPGAGVAIKFPENVKKNNENRNSDNPLHYRQHADMFQFPSTYQFDDVDKLYMDSCYRGLPAMTLGKYKFPLDPTIGEESGGSNEESFRDFYGRLINSFGDFISGEMEDSDGVDLNSRWLEFNIDPADEDNNNPSVYRARRDDFSPVDTLWLGLNEIDASEVVLSDGNTQVTLKNFADRYGLFDGIDNDNDGIRDYEWRDNKPGDEPDGVYDIKWYDFDEADGIYGIPSQNTGEIARKLLSHNSAYTIPYGLEGFPYHEFGENVTLTVNSHPYKNRRISSMIIHNEPTAYTIMQQEKSLAAQSMPIDNPRYVAFQSAPAAHIQNPNPPEPLDGLNIQSHYYPGQIHKINYVNLFKIPNMAQLQSELAQKAQEIAQIPGSYRIFGEDAGPDDYTVLEISRKIYEDYFAPAVNNLDDRPESGFDLEAAATRKIHDALKWKEMGIDDKHEYILEFYLNDDELHDAYAGDSPKGYEAAYFVLNGGEDSFEMNFNKSQPEETDLRFDPVAPYVSDTDVAAAAGPAPEETVEDEVGFVWLDEFLGELQGFFDDFENVGVKEVEFSDVKFDVPAVETEITGDAPIDIDIEAESRVLVANGRSRTKLEFILRDKNGNIANSSYAQVSVFADNILELDATGDLSGKIPGVQLASFDGKVDIEVTAKNTSGNGKIIAVLTDSELEDLLLETDDISKINFENYPGKSVTIEVVEDAYLELSVLDENFDATESVAADGQSLARIAVKLKSGDRVLNSYNGPVKFTLLTEILGRFTGELPEKMTNGILAPGNVNFQSGTRAGDVEILVEAPDFARNIVKFKSLPGDPVKLEMQSSSNILPSENEEIVLQARVTDRFGNLVNTMNGKTVRFSPTEASSALVEFDPAVAVASGGVATTVLRGKKVSGTINIIAESDDLIPAKVSFKASKKVDAEKIKDFEPRALYVSVLGGNFGDTDGTNVAETMLYNGKVQAVSAVTTSAKNLRLFGVDGYGRLEIFENGVKSVEVAATDSFPFPKTILSDSVNDTELAEIFIVPSNDGQKFDHDARLLVMDEYLENYLPGVYIMPKSSSGKYGFVEAFSGNSDIEPKGFYFVDFETEIDQAQLPGSPFTSLEDAGEKFGLGLEGDNKHMLFFAAGNSVGESNIPYASDAGMAIEWCA